MLRRETDLLGKEIYIGTTLFQDPRVARLVPLALARPDGWRRVEPARFPDEGNVFSVDPKVVRRPKGYVVLFTITRNDRPGGRDRFITAEVDEPFELVRELASATADARRTVMMETGLDRNLQEEPRVLVPIGDGEVTFPRLQRSGPGARWTLALQEEADRIEVYATPTGGFREFVVDDHAFALPGRVPARSVGCVNWQADAEFLQYLVRKVRKTGTFTSASDDFKVTDRMLVRLHAFYRDANVIGERAGANEALRDRLGEFLAKLTTGSAALADIADALHGHQEIRSALARLSEADLDELRDRELARLRPALTSQIEGELAERYAERDAVLGELDDVTGRLAARTEALHQVEALAGPGMASLREGLGSYLERISEAGSTLERMAELAGSRTPSGGAAATGDSSPWASASTRHDRALPPVEFVAAAEERAKGLGLSVEVLRTLDVLCRAGEIPTLFGDSVEIAIRCYADLVAGGEVARMPLDPTILGPDDVWRRPGSGEQTVFAKAWRAASTVPDRFVLLCLDDLDRASLSDWFPRFRSLYRGGRPSNLLVIATVTDNETAKTRGDDLATRVSCHAGRRAYLAALRGRELPEACRLVPPSRPTLSPDERESLFERLSAIGGGGDLGRRLMDVYLASRVWLDHSAACEFAAGTVAPADRPAHRSDADGRVIPLNATNERKEKSS
ncbi:hypothetical protein [Methylobacterium pseudosasicola]|uniref:Uncharacterized protein n=1 Tax=Methylobacterium pseudosasicola TaxID=582667 RepID=A0A1I4HUM9_9HYPH|nr:hypothetical protein [Methylobacterium pseudosasicola]SFL45852.1 hypothetical protein SAMN05192568_100568 [Methylobacterium pseudosasicola]